MNLHESETDFVDLIQTTAADLGISAVLVEKDYWVTFVLKRLSLSGHANDVVFKGGTSLSKAHKLIHRFSEDIDLALKLSAFTTENSAKKKLRNIEKDLMNAPFVENTADEGKVTDMKIRKSAHTFPTLKVGGTYAQGHQQIILEINRYTTPTPTSVLPLMSLAGEFLVKSKNNTALSDYGLESFELEVLSLKRTFVEKICGLAKASRDDYQDMKHLKSKVRHLYDVALLYEHPEVKNFFTSKDFDEIFENVRSEDQKNVDGKGKWAHLKLRDCLLAKDSEGTLKRVKDVYENEFYKGFVYQGRPLPSIKIVGNVIDAIFKRVKVIEDGQDIDK
jgi:predicted nucleotidyltransferase component of viral defense system